MPGCSSFVRADRLALAKWVLPDLGWPLWRPSWRRTVGQCAPNRSRDGPPLRFGFPGLKGEPGSRLTSESISQISTS